MLTNVSAKKRNIPFSPVFVCNHIMLLSFDLGPILRSTNHFTQIVSFYVLLLQESEHLLTDPFTLSLGRHHVVKPMP